MDKSGRLDSASSLAGKSTRERCGRCAGAGCNSCHYRGYNPVHVYAEGRGEQGEDYSDLTEEQVKSALDRGIDLEALTREDLSRRLK